MALTVTKQTNRPRRRRRHHYLLRYSTTRRVNLRPRPYFQKQHH